MNEHTERPPRVLAERPLPSPARPSLVVMRQPVNQAAVDLLKDMLARVERAEINFVAVIGTTPDGCVVDGWAGGTDIRPYTVLGGLAAMSQEFGLRNIERL